MAKGSGHGVLEYKELARLAAKAGLIRDPHLAEVAVLGGRVDLHHRRDVVLAHQRIAVAAFEARDPAEGGGTLRSGQNRLLWAGVGYGSRFAAWCVAGEHHSQGCGIDVAAGEHESHPQSALLATFAE